MPVWLRYDGHTETCCLKRTSDDGSTKRRVIDISIAREQNDVNLIPSP